jgi:hypothetical protein
MYEKKNGFFIELQNVFFEFRIDDENSQNEQDVWNNEAVEEDENELNLVGETRQARRYNFCIASTHCRK